MIGGRMIDILTLVLSHTKKAMEEMTVRLFLLTLCICAAITVRASAEPSPRAKPPCVDISFTSPQHENRHFDYFSDGIPRLGELAKGARIDTSEHSLLCSGGGAILPRSSHYWNALRESATIEIVFKIPAAMKDRTRQALVSFGGVTGWPSMSIGKFTSVRFLVFYPTTVEPTAFSDSGVSLLPDRWYTAVLSFDAALHILEYSIAEKRIAVTNADFHTRTTFFEKIFIGSSGTIPIGDGSKDGFDGAIRSVRIWRGMEAQQ